MTQALWNGYSGLIAANNWLDRVGDNLANVDTAGFAADQGTFADALTMQLYPPATGPTDANRTTPPGWRGGTGVVAIGESSDFDGMSVRTTGNSTDLAIQGPGFFTVNTPQGKMYTKDGNFDWSQRPDGRFQLTTAQGYPVLAANGQPIVEPTNPGKFVVGPNGQISFGNTQGPRMAIVDIGEPSQHLIPQSNNLYTLAASGQAGPATQSQIVQGALLYSNVNETQEMADMIQAQAMYQQNSESVSIANQMMGLANTIRQSGN